MTTRLPRTTTSATARAWRAPSSCPTGEPRPKSPPAPPSPPTPPTPPRLRGKGGMTRMGSSPKRPSGTWTRATMTPTTTPTPPCPRRRSGPACRPTRTPSTRGSEALGARKGRRGSRPSSNQACSSRAHLARKAPPAFQDPQEQRVPLAKWVTLESGVPRGARASLGLTACPARQGPCSCCPSASEAAVTRAPRAPWSQPRSRRRRPSCSRPGWR